MAAGEGTGPVRVAGEATRGEISATVHARPSRLALAFVVGGGVVWVGGTVVLASMLASCFPSCGADLVSLGGGSGYSPQALRTLNWLNVYLYLYTAALGMVALIIGVTGFRRGETWAWLALLVIALSGVGTGILDELTWGGWYTGALLGIPLLLGLALSAKPLFRGARFSMARSD